MNIAKLDTTRIAKVPQLLWVQNQRGDSGFDTTQLDNYDGELRGS